MKIMVRVYADPRGGAVFEDQELEVIGVQGDPGGFVHYGFVHKDEYVEIRIPLNLMSLERVQKLIKE